MPTETKLTTIFKLGKVAFSVRNCDAQFAEQLEQLLPRCEDSTVREEDIIDVNMGCCQDFTGLINHIYRRQKGCLWINAACLLSPSGRKVLIAGIPGSGKSTVAMTLALGYGWKVWSEDITVFDYKRGKILGFASPFALRAGTRELLQDAVDIDPQPILLNEFMPVGELAVRHDGALPVDVSIILEQMQPAPEQMQPPLEQTQPALEQKEISLNDYMRQILQISNILRLDDGTTAFETCFDATRCFALSGGTLRERVNKIIEI